MDAPQIHNPPNTIERIDAVWMAVSVDPKTGFEGVCGAQVAPGMLAPLIAADESRLEWVQATAQKIADLSGRTIRIIKLHARDELAVIEPQEKPQP